MQTVLPALLLLTYPSPSGPPSLGRFPAFHESNRWDVAAPLVLMTLSGAVNWFGLLPMTRVVKEARKRQETKEGKIPDGSGSQSDEMKALNKRFGMLHGLSNVVNLVEIIATIAYGIVLSQRIT
jgi:hypothetical protein